jgi:plastocyanin
MKSSNQRFFLIRALLITSTLAGQVTSAQTQEAAIGGCNPQDFVVLEGPVVKVGINGRGYTPKCARVKPGTQVIIDATSNHPLQGIPTTGVVNPIVDELGGAVTPKTVVFTQNGTFGYFCIAHGDDTGVGMVGAILVE